MATWKLTIEYKGTRYQGWQEQARGKTVQGELRRAASDFLGEEIDLGGSGRTDAGVHALAQVAHLRATKKRPEGVLQQGINDRLPADIHVLKVEPAPERFHARHSAQSRYYLYQISTRRTAFAKDYVWWVRQDLDLKAMSECARLFRGRHDFASFTERPEDQGSTLVEVEDVLLAHVDDLILIRVGASHFLWKMVRRMIGVIVQVGLHQLDPTDPKKFLQVQSHSIGRWTAPASGLFLERVIYPGEPSPGKIQPAVPVHTP